MEKEWMKIKRSLKYLKLYSFAVTLAVIGLFLWIYHEKSNQPEGVIRVRGIIVEDDNGKERILIGAPVPFAPNRVRTDTTRVKESWGRFFPPEYMTYYKEYNHEANGIIILDSDGYDRMAIGSPTPDPNIGKRIGPATGIQINDELGFERSGYGILNVNGKNRVVLGLDNENGTEGLSLVLFEDGTGGVVMSGENRTLFLGKADTANWFTKDRFPFNGLLVRDHEGSEIMLNAAEEISAGRSRNE